MQLAGKVAIVTGSTKGIGRAIAQQYAGHGARVIVHGRDRHAGEEVVQRIRARGGQATFVASDMSEEDDVKALIGSAAEGYGGLDVLVNNAAAVSDIGAGGDGPLETLDTATFDHMLKVGLYGPFWACREAVPRLRERGGGSIINISSLVSLNPQHGLAGYCTSKAALNGLTRQLAGEYAPQNIRANAILVGVILSGEFAQLVATDASFKHAIDGVGLIKYGEPDDIANLATFLAGDASRFITGALIAADGSLGAKSQVPDFSSLIGALTPSTGDHDAN